MIQPDKAIECYTRVSIECPVWYKLNSCSELSFKVRVTFRLLRNVIYCVHFTLQWFPFSSDLCESFWLHEQWSGNAVTCSRHHLAYSSAALPGNLLFKWLCTICGTGSSMLPQLTVL